MKVIIIKQLNTEKTHKLVESGVYSFFVPRDIKKEEVKKEVERLFGVKVDGVNLLLKPKKIKSFRGKYGELKRYKKAYVKVAKGMKIDFENVVKNG